ncbi:choice-of-anchor I family protein [Massilia glaciei]|uniref:Alkaline phosphatase n=1 Tax=Massilia glaciei TaxID=1524097 RepID=A0A2U2HM64_9BURK|nr:choice-of-anchor I family protein [Massilia glaciei]PWF48611.1 alkaline phosphatase [Massilia glaciei]
MTIPTRRHLLAMLFPLTMLASCGGSDVAPTPTSLSLEKIGAYDGAAAGAAEITAYDPPSKRLFVVNGANGSVDVLDLATPSAPKLLGTISVAALGGGVNSVAIHDGLVALAVEAKVKTAPGVVAFYNAADLKFLHAVGVGALPDMVAFTPDGKSVLVANEGEPNSYGLADSVDPEGSVSVITVNRGGTPTVATAHFKDFIGREADLRNAGVRLYGPGANAAQDLEPEYIVVAADGKTAYVTLQENNAIALVDIAGAKITSVKPLGFKNHNVAGAGMDASDEDGGTNTNSGTPAIKIAPQPVKGMYLPDGMAMFSVKGGSYLITANEGDARADWPGFDEEVRVRAHCPLGLDPAVFGADAANLLFDSNLGRLRVTSTPNGGKTGKNALGQCSELFSFGARSFSIWSTDIVRVYDSGDELEQRTKALSNVAFNASHDNNSLDGRSASKGPEPEGVVVGAFGDKTFAFVGLERIGGVAVYDVSVPTAPVFATYLNTRTGATGDRGPEGLALVMADKSPNGKPLLIVGNEVSGTTAIYQLNLTY